MLNLLLFLHFQSEQEHSSFIACDCVTASRRTHTRRNSTQRSPYSQSLSYSTFTSVIIFPQNTKEEIHVFFFNTFCNFSITSIRNRSLTCFPLNGLFITATPDKENSLVPASFRCFPEGRLPGATFPVTQRKIQPTFDNKTPFLDSESSPFCDVWHISRRCVCYQRYLRKS